MPIYQDVKAKIDELETNSKIKNIRDLFRDIINFKKNCQIRTDIVKDEKGDIVTVPLYFAQVKEPPLSAMGLMKSGRQKYITTTSA